MISRYFSCLSLPWSAPSCTEFWIWIIAACFLFAFVVGVSILVGLVKYQRKVIAAMEAQAQREAVDLAEIEAVRWTGDDHYGEGGSK